MPIMPSSTLATRTRDRITVLLIVLALPLNEAFYSEGQLQQQWHHARPTQQPHQRHNQNKHRVSSVLFQDLQSRRDLNYAEEEDRGRGPPPPPPSVSIDIVQVRPDEESICEAASFLVDAFWLDPRHSVQHQKSVRRYPGNNNQRSQQQSQRSRQRNSVQRSDIRSNNFSQNNQRGSQRSSNNQRDNNDDHPSGMSRDARQNLFNAQASDLLNRYGELMGQTILENCILKAVDVRTGATLGLLCVSALLFDTQTEELLLHEDSEQLLISAVGTLGPRDRQQFKGATAQEIVSGMMAGEMVAVCCISNLAVSQNARRLGIAAELCREAERIASTEWGYDAMLLKVEAGNNAARKLYERKLGYQFMAKETDAGAFRVDARDGRFLETAVDTLVLAKDI